MAVTVMQVGIMRVLVHDRQMAMSMRVWFYRRIAQAVRVLVVLIMHMAMLVFERLVRVLVLMPLGEMQVDPDRHQHAGSNELRGKGLSE
jgi:hypothetical protein